VVKLGRGKGRKPVGPEDQDHSPVRTSRSKLGSLQ